MSALPVITALGGISPAGRSSSNHGFNRLIFDALDAGARERTLASLRALTGLTGDEQLLQGTLIRRLESNIFDPLHIPLNVNGDSDAPVEVKVRNLDLPESIPEHWQVTPAGRNHSLVRISSGSLLLPATRESKVMAAGQLPSGFDPAALYASRNHPRGLQMAIYAASDALGNLGIDWQTVCSVVPPEKIAVYASAAMAQLDDNGFGGMLKSPGYGKRITSKQLPLGLAEMPADFINAYVLGSVGRTGGMLGACASFLYNLSLAIHDIRSGRARVAMVGTAEAPLVAEVMEGYRAMGALGEDSELLKLDPHLSEPDWRRACRPFGFNCGFTIAESSQFVVVMDDALALELGADILAAVPDVFVHADGIKKSISAPGVGNHLTLGRAMALGRQLLGEQRLRQNTFVSAHGTGTPQNRVTESHVLNEMAKAFGVESWPVCAVKAYLGHSIASAAGDQLMAAIGTFNTGTLPGIVTTDRLAPDLHNSNLDIRLKHSAIEAPAAAFLNSKGFGGNNATAMVMAPSVTMELLARRHGQTAVDAWSDKVSATRAARDQWDASCLSGEARPVYRFAEGVIDGEDLEISDKHIALPGSALKVTLDEDRDFDDYL